MSTRVETLSAPHTRVSTILPGHTWDEEHPGSGDYDPERVCALGGVSLGNVVIEGGPDQLRRIGWAMLAAANQIEAAPRFPEPPTGDADDRRDWIDAWVQHAYDASQPLLRAVIGLSIRFEVGDEHDYLVITRKDGACVVVQPPTVDEVGVFVGLYADDQEDRSSDPVEHHRVSWSLDEVARVIGNLAVVTVPAAPAKVGA